MNPNIPADAGRVPDWTLGDKLRKARESAGLEMQELAAEIDIHRQSVARYERGEAKPKRHVLLAWSSVTGVNLEWLSGSDSTYVEQSKRSTDLRFNPFDSPGSLDFPGISFTTEEEK